MSHCVWELASEASILAWRFPSNPREAAAESLMEPNLSVHAHPPEIEMKVKLVHKTVSVKTREQSLRWNSHSKIHLDPFHLTRIWCLLNESRVQPLAKKKKENDYVLKYHHKPHKKKTIKWFFFFKNTAWFMHPHRAYFTVHVGWTFPRVVVK